MFENLSHLLHKTKNMCFHGLGRSNIVTRQSRKGPLKLKNFREKLLVANKARDSRKTLCVIL